MADEILVVTDGQQPLGTGAWELLALGRSLAGGPEGRVHLLPLGGDAAGLVQEAGAAGADLVYKVSGALCPGYHPELFTVAALQACQDMAPRAVLLPHSPLGLDLAPRLAFRLGANWASGCVAAALQNGELVCTRHLHGGKVALVESYPGTPVVVTVRAKSVDPLSRRAGYPAKLVPLTMADGSDAGPLTFLERFEREAGAAAELARAEVIVSAGRGVGSAEGVARVQALADALGGSLGASKGAVDRGWVPADRQIGLTGATVAPRLYVAVGISGAMQHYVGCRRAKTIVAINSDPAAPIFRFAHYGVVAEWEDVLPMLAEQLHNLG